MKRAFKLKQKSIFYHFKRAFNQANNTFFLKGESPTLITFQQNLKRHVSDYNDVNFNDRLSLLKSYEIFENSVIVE